MGKMLYLCLATAILLQLLSPLSAFTGQDVENVRSMIDLTHKASGVKYFSSVTQGNKEGYSGCLKITVTKRFLKESQASKEGLMRKIYDAWKQNYKGTDEALVGFVDTKDVLVGMATDKGILWPK